MAKITYSMPPFSEMHEQLCLFWSNLNSQLRGNSQCLLDHAGQTQASAYRRGAQDFVKEGAKVL